MCTDPILFILGIIVSCLMGLLVVLVGLSIVVLKVSPKSKLSDLIRRHLISDVDLEP